MKRFITNVANAAAVLAIILSPASVLALGQPQSEQVPDVAGTYDVPGQPDVKVKVSVYRAKNAKPDGSGHGNPKLQCSLADPDSSSVVPTTGWKLPTSVTYNLNTTSVPATVGGANLATIAANGFSDWQTATNGQVTFTRGDDTTSTSHANDGVNVIAWKAAGTGALATTYTHYNTVTHEVLDVDTIFSSSFTWYWSTQQNCAYTGVYDAEDILTHELGHWVGLNDTYDASYQDNTMYGYGFTGEVKKDTLSAGDTATAYQIYNF